MSRLLLPLLALLLVTAPPVAAQSFEDALAAYRRGDYATALKFYRALAEQCDARGLNGLGVMYVGGTGVPKDSQQGMRYFHEAAEQGLRLAKYNLANQYHFGWNTPKDYVLALMYYNLAAADEPTPDQILPAWPVITERDELRQKMTPEQIEEAQKRTKDWKDKPRYCDKVTRLMKRPVNSLCADAHSDFKRFVLTSTSG